MFVGVIFDSSNTGNYFLWKICDRWGGGGRKSYALSENFSRNLSK